MLLNAVLSDLVVGLICGPTRVSVSLGARVRRLRKL